MRTALAGLAFLFASTFAPAAHAEPAAAFETLRTLVGEWEGTTEAGRHITVTYRLIANDTVLVESWTLSPTRQSMTVYHMDGDTLIATHYCPLGNQPRLQYVDDNSQPATFRFVFRDATNLPDLAVAHQHSFWIHLRDDGALERSETYVQDGQEGAEAITYTRVR